MIARLVKRARGTAAAPPPTGGGAARRAAAGESPPHVASRPGRRITIRELADYTGLSPAAVSYALRGMQVSAATERRVREAATELGYEADPIARALAGGPAGGGRRPPRRRARSRHPEVARAGPRG